MNWIEIVISFFCGFGLCLALVMWTITDDQPRQYFRGYEGKNGDK